MKTTYISLITLLCGMLQTGCTCDSVPAEPTANGNGTFALSLITEDIQTEDITRTESTIDKSSFKVNLKDKEGILLIDGKAYGNLTEADRTLPAGTGYQIAVESCTKEEASSANEGWGAMRFTGSATFDIVSDKTTEVEINSVMENAGLQLVFDESFTTKFPTYAATTQDSRALVFKGSNPDAIAFFDIEEGTTTPTVSLKLTGSAGGWSDRIEKVKDVGIAKGKITKLTIIYDENSGNIDIEFETDTDIEEDENKNDVTVQ